MTFILIWGFLLLLLGAVIFLFWFQFKNTEVQQPADIQIVQLEE